MLQPTFYSSPYSTLRTIFVYRTGLNPANMPTENELLDATARGDMHQVRNLLDEGIDPNIQGDSGWAAIHQAAKEGNHELAELLLEYGCDPNAKEDSGLTSLHFAAQKGHDLTVQLLLDYWADPNAQDKSECTPLHYASKNGHVRVVRLLLGHDDIPKEEKSAGRAYVSRPKIKHWAPD